MYGWLVFASIKPQDGDPVEIKLPEEEYIDIEHTTFETHYHFLATNFTEAYELANYTLSQQFQDFEITGCTRVVEADGEVIDFILVNDVCDCAICRGKRVSKDKQLTFNCINPKCNMEITVAKERFIGLQCPNCDTMIYNNEDIQRYVNNETTDE